MTITLEWVSVYFFALHGFHIFLNLVKDGEPKNDKYSFSQTLAGFMVVIPIYGRWFGWW